MVRYLSLWWSFFSNTLTRDMEFKANFIGSLIVDAIYYGVHFFFFSIIFSYVDVLGQFTAADVKIFLVITFLGDTVYMMLFSGNLFSLNRLIVSGDLDFSLIRPVNGQFMVSFRYVKSYAIISLGILGLLLAKLISENPNEKHPYHATDVKGVNGGKLMCDFYNPQMKRNHYSNRRENGNNNRNNYNNNCKKDTT